LTADRRTSPTSPPDPSGWFAPTALPELSLTRNTAEQVTRLVALAVDPAAPAAFD